ncbi:MAG: electron transfer flavoprotein subunit beta/FixA family protein [Proteobacteria bacterium]|nr:electron transfer flavoprotein subunit beta/FixA family protein [Pseudomonadota bacterium]MBU4297525.1 electron transfer flavoprotein subunit beta/FixA family protein [Pseudomonadota bacterium]MCG2749743.1 electron transfer flavoprotein subunit beta/FixA family protein [Desulfobulbaceae bacterium]
MKILVCIKQVPDAKDVRLDPKTNTLSREGVQSIINPYDRHALEEAVRLKEKHGGTVIVLTMGPPQAQEILRESVSCGADEAVLVSDRAFAGADTLATTYTLSQAIKKIGGADLILCGKQAIDGDTAQVGPGLAVRMDIPYVTCVRKIVEVSDKTFVVERLMDDGYDEVEVELPALFTVVKEINEPRLPSLKGKMKAKKLAITTLTAADIDADTAQLGLKGSPTWVVRVFAPQLKGERTMIEGTVQAQVDQLAEKLMEWC